MNIIEVNLAYCTCCSVSKESLQLKHDDDLNEYVCNSIYGQNREYLETGK